MTLSPVISRMLALAILVALIWGANALAVQPLLATYRANEDSIARSQELVQRYRRIGGRRSALEAQIAQVRERLSPAGLYLEAASDALVAAELQNRVKGVVEAASGRLKSTQILPAVDESNFRRVGIRVQMSATVEPLQRVFFELEAAMPYLFIENVDVRRRVTKRRKRKGSERSPETESVLTVRFDLFGYTRAGGA